jgi:hypothetical protein
MISKIFKFSFLLLALAFITRKFLFHPAEILKKNRTVPFTGYKKLVRLQILNRYSDWTFFYIAPESCSECKASESEFDKLQSSWNPNSRINFIKILISDSERPEADKLFKQYPTI